MYLTWREIPPGWPSYTDLTGHEWRLADDGYWWLKHGTMFRRQEVPSATTILGVPVPPGILRDHECWLHSNEANTTHFSGKAIVTNTGGSGSYTVTHHSGSAPALSGTGSLSAVANIPPDFADLPLGPDCCRTCHLNDGPLYDGGLCRYCWILRQQPRPAEPVAARGTNRGISTTICYVFLVTTTLLPLLYVITLIFR